MFFHIACFLRVLKGHILHWGKPPISREFFMKTKSNQKEEDPNQPSGQGIHRNTGDVGFISYFSSLPPPGECHYISYSGPFSHLLWSSSSLYWPPLPPQTFQQRSDSSLGHLHCTPVTELYNPCFLLLREIFTPNTRENISTRHWEGRPAEQPGIWVPVPKVGLHSH